MIKHLLTTKAPLYSDAFVVLSYVYVLVSSFVNSLLKSLCIIDIEKSAELDYNIGVAFQNSVSCQQTQGRFKMIMNCRKPPPCSEFYKFFKNHILKQYCFRVIVWFLKFVLRQFWRLFCPLRY